MKNFTKNEILDLLEELGLDATEELVRGIQSITWNINEEDIPLAIEGFYNLNLDFSSLRRITYATGDFKEWLENKVIYDGGFEVDSFEGTLYFVWTYSEGIQKQVKKRVSFR